MAKDGQIKWMFESPAGLTADEKGKQLAFEEERRTSPSASGRRKHYKSPRSYLKKPSLASGMRSSC